MNQLLTCLFVCITISACTSPYEQKLPHIPQTVKTVGVITSFGQDLTYGGIGLTRLEDTRKAVDINDWKIQEFANARIKERLNSDGYDVVFVPLNKSILACDASIFSKSLDQKLRESLPADHPNVDLWVVLNNTVPTSQQPCQEALSVITVDIFFAKTHVFATIGANVDLFRGSDLQHFSSTWFNRIGPDRKMDAPVDLALLPYPDRWDEVTDAQRAEIKSALELLISDSITATFSRLGL